MDSSNSSTSNSIQDLKDIAHKLRILSIQATNAAKSGHPTSCCSMAEIMSVLFFHTMKYKVQEPRNRANDRFVLSKGHAAPILYAAWCEAGLFPEEEMLNLRKFDSDLEGHPTPRLSFVDVASGSLGIGINYAAGMAYTGKYFDKGSYRVYCVIGDGESAEGSVWETLSFSGYYKLDNFTVLIDVNRLGQSDPTMFQHEIDVYRDRCQSFGCNTVVVDGNSVEALVEALQNAERCKGKPTVIVCKTFKGKALSADIEDKLNWHGKALGSKGDSDIKVLQSLIKRQGNIPPVIKAPVDDVLPVDTSRISLSEPPNYKLGEMVATRFAYGTALVKLCNNNKRVIALDGDTKNSTFSEKVLQSHPDRFIEGFIAEQNLVGVTVGCATRGRTVPFVSMFGCFFSRAFDQLRMASISQANINCCGSHCGVSIGEDGPSQMGLEDLALFRTLHGSTVFYPTDAVAIERACELAANTQGICYIRAGRPNTPVIYANDESFAIGKAKIIRKKDNDEVLIIGAGITLYEALKAADLLEKDGIHARVMDPFTIKPLDTDAVRDNAKQCGGRVVVVEDHYPEGGLGDAVSMAVACCRDIIVKRLAVNDLPRSGPPEVLIEMFGIGAKSIIAAVMELKNR